MPEITEELEEEILEVAEVKPGWNIWAREYLKEKGFSKEMADFLVEILEEGKSWYGLYDKEGIFNR